MASLAIAAVGALAAGGLGFSPQIGFLIGSVVGTLLFPPPGQETTTEGPRLGDLSVSASTYGTAIPISYGTVRVSGNMIWSSGIREVKHTETSGGGKGGLGGGPKQTQITYTYFVDMALSFGAGPADAVSRIFADGKIIYDATKAPPSRLSGLRFRFYDGGEDQLPDSIIEASEGSGQVPGHRGLCYIVFDDLPLENFGNRVPNITAEISFNATKTTVAVKGTNIDDSASFQVDILTTDFVRRRAYLDSDGGLRVFDMDTMNEIRQSGSLSDGLGITTIAGKFTGNIYTGNSTFKLINKYDPESFVRTAFFGTGGFGTSNNTTSFAAPTLLLEGSCYNATGGVRNFLMQKAQFDDLGLLDADSMEYIWHLNQTVGVTGFQTAWDRREGECVFWISFSESNIITLAKLTVSSNAAYNATFATTVGVSYEPSVATFDLNALSTNGTPSTITGPFLDRDDDGLFWFVAQSGGGSMMIKWIEGQGTIYINQLDNVEPNVQRTQAPMNSDVRNGRLSWLGSNGSACLIVDTSNGTELSTPVDITNAGTFSIGGQQGAFVYDGDAEGFICMDGSAGNSDVVKVFLEQISTQGIALSSIVEDLSTRAGYDTAVDLDTTELTDNVKGYLVSRQMTYRQALEPLAQAFFFEAVESDDQIKFVKRGASSILTIPQSELIEVGDESEVIPEQRTQEVELPERISVLYMDVDQDYQQGTESSKRVRQPIPAMRSRVETSLALPIVFTATEAKQISEKLLFSAWNERTAYRFKLPQEYLTLDPTDIVTVTLDNGTTFLVHVSSITVGADLTLEVEGISESSVTFSSTATSGGGLGFPQKPPASPAATKLFLVNVPLLRDIDDTAGLASRVYYGMSGFQDGWDGGSLLQSLDSGSTFDEISRALAGTDWGVTINALPATTTPFQTDETTSLEVFMQVGELSSVSQEQFLADANVALVGSPTTNVWEVIAYRDVTQNTNGTYTLNGLIRAKRGTDPFVNSHAVSEFFLPLNSSNFFAFLLPLAQRNNSLPYKGVGFSQIQEDVNAETFVGLARDLMPYAPAQQTAVLNASDIDISWVRRTRIGGALVDGLGTVPLGETTEAYELDIYNAAGDTIVQAVTGLTSPTYTYPAADITADFGTTPSELTLEVFQISEAVGRGFTNRVTIPVE
ncbi:gp86 [Alphaproteobacteria phage PhiJL001]|uniref:Gp86 n=1 Tax=Alphaproteobacteria phage PhiJL001 TaxID=2681607 RepID=Q5DN19_9CAUD|nr:tail protein [Alphaproteobacteria phage PhiJL001]AAT69483.1 gp86 [Alphaproteobacteria phage PhiJL001]